MTPNADDRHFSRLLVNHRSGSVWCSQLLAARGFRCPSTPSMPSRRIGVKNGMPFKPCFLDFFHRSKAAEKQTCILVTPADELGNEYHADSACMTFWKPNFETMREWGHPFSFVYRGGTRVVGRHAEDNQCGDTFFCLFCVGLRDRFSNGTPFQQACIYAFHAKQWKQEFCNHFEHGFHCPPLILALNSLKTGPKVPLKPKITVNNTLKSMLKSSWCSDKKK